MAEKIGLPRTSVLLMRADMRRFFPSVPSHSNKQCCIAAVNVLPDNPDDFYAIDRNIGVQLFRTLRN